ncbi:hypothetical protein GCM10009558_073080 [Virgisporangium aurantiacum]
MGAAMVLVTGVQLTVTATANAVDRDAMVIMSGFSDTFDGAVSLDPSYGLNDSLAGRQKGNRRGATYTRTSGRWNSNQPPAPTSSRVNQADHPGALTFFDGHSAVRLDAPVQVGVLGAINVRTIVDPVTGDTTSGQWASVVLSADRDNSGYVTNAAVDLGVIVRSDGRATVFHAGTAVGSTTARPDANGRFTVTVATRSGSRTAKVTVNDTVLTAPMDRAFPASPTLFLGAYLDDPGARTSFYGLSVSDLNMSGLAPPIGSGPDHFGYFGARFPPGPSHVADVRGRSTVSYISISDLTGYATDVFDDCAENSCVVYTGWEFFTGCPGPPSPCDLYPNYRDRWRRLAAAVEPHLAKVAAFYLLDEPYHRGASPDEVAAAATEIKATFDKPVMLVEAGYKVPTITVPDNVDWVGFDDYCKPIGEIESILRTLIDRTPGGQRLFLMPQAAPLPSCPSRHRTDAELAQLQWDYANLAERYPRVGGLMTFGLWVEGTQPPQLPRTIDAHERIAARTIAR